jgi:hypothetical protein
MALDDLLQRAPADAQVRRRVFKRKDSAKRPVIICSLRYLQFRLSVK